jgi:hypothetical protein
MVKGSNHDATPSNEIVRRRPVESMKMWRCTTEATSALWHVNPVGRFIELVFMPQPLIGTWLFVVPSNGTGFAPFIFYS